MKIFLNTCLVAMLGAGLYGGIDLAQDINDGTYIHYEEEPEGSIVPFIHDSRFITRKPVIRRTIKTDHHTKPPTLLTVSDLDMGDFSRGEPVFVYEELFERGASDSLKNAGVTLALKDTIRALAENKKEAKVADTSSVTTKEDRKFSLKLYSRGRPTRIKEETLAIRDSTHK